MDMPQMKREKDIVKWADEIADFAKMVEDFTGKTLTVKTSMLQLRPSMRSAALLLACTRHVKLRIVFQ